jgi:L-fucono-1,5-lactonase
MMIDAHHHLWKYKPKEYGWMDHTMALLQQDYCPENLEPELQGRGLIGTVVVQARQSLEETRWLLELADEYPFIKGVVGWVDLCSRELEKQLKELAVHPKLVGVRHVIQDELDDDFMLRDDFRQGISALQTFNLVYDLLLFPRHLDCAVKLVKEFPKQRFVLDHLAKPLIKSRKMEPWKSDITSLASFPNVWCKLSGMVTEADLDNWQYEDFVPYMEVVLEAFGHERIMLGSDWPVCRLAAEYSEVIEIVTEFIKPLKKSEREKILYQNAIDCYQLKIKD